MKLRGYYRLYGFSKDGRLTRIVNEVTGENEPVTGVFFKVSRFRYSTQRCESTKKRYDTLKEALSSAFTKVGKDGVLGREYVIRAENESGYISYPVLHLAGCTDGLYARDVRDPRDVGCGELVFVFNRDTEGFKWGKTYADCNKDAEHIKEWLPRKRPGKGVGSISHLYIQIKGVDRARVVQSFSEWVGIAEREMGLYRLPPVRSLVIAPERLEKQGKHTLRIGGEYSLEHRQITLYGLGSDIRKRFFHEYGHHVHYLALGTGKRPKGEESEGRMISRKIAETLVGMETMMASYKDAVSDKDILMRHKEYVCDEREVFARMFSAIMLKRVGGFEKRDFNDSEVSEVLGYVLDICRLAVENGKTVEKWGA